MNPINIKTEAMGQEVSANRLQQDVNSIMERLNRDFSGYYDQLQSYGVQGNLAQWIFLSLITYVLRSAEDYAGGDSSRIPQLLRDLRRDAPMLFEILHGHGLSDNLIDSMLMEIIKIILNLIVGQPGPGPGPGPSPAPGWSRWEDLGGVLTSAPAVSSWQANRLDVFGRGQNQSLWHKWWDGSNWSQWEDLGGVLTSAPAAVSWGPNRIDVFGRGQNQSLWHKWWDGSRWSQWEDLRGGSISSGPAAASTGPNRLELFARGSQGQLLFRTWNGNRWSPWESLGGVISSEPAAVSWGGRRLDVFARGQNNHLWHIWRE